MIRRLPCLLALLLLVGACGEPEPPSRAATEAPPQAAAEPSPEPPPHRRPDDRGWQPVDRSLPRLAHAGGLWRLDDEPLEHVAAEGRSRELLLEGKMVLDDSRPMRRAFWLAPHYDGCVDAHARYHRPHWIRVTLPDGEAVQVTDRDLQVQGRLDGRTDDGRLRVRASRVAPGDLRLERGPRG